MSRASILAERAESCGRDGRLGNRERFVEAQLYATLAVYEALIDLSQAVRERRGQIPLAREPLPPSEP